MHSNRLLQKFHKLLFLVPLQRNINAPEVSEPGSTLYFSLVVGNLVLADISSFVYLVPKSKVLTTTLVFSPLSPSFTHQVPFPCSPPFDQYLISPSRLSSQVGAVRAFPDSSPSMAAALPAEPLQHLRTHLPHWAFMLSHTFKKKSSHVDIILFNFPG